MAATAVATTLIPNNAQAVLNIYLFDDTKGNLTIEAHGTLQLGTDFGSGGGCSSGAPPAFIIPTDNALNLCADNQLFYSIEVAPGATTHQPWGTDNSQQSGTFSGSDFGLEGDGAYTFQTTLTSGALFNSTATFSPFSISSLGLDVNSGLLAKYQIKQTKDIINLYVDAPPDPPPANVPAPLPFAGAAAAFGWSRRLRRRISLKRHTRCAGSDR
jgi:hypothetical protein